jgi:hypothetical protein
MQNLKLDTLVSVSFTFDSVKRRAVPRSVVWNGRLYGVSKVGLHHTYREGRTLYHVFSVTCGNLFFRLVFNTENLHWRLTEVFDGVV